jgi:hypothetical protein
MGMPYLSFPRSAWECRGDALRPGGSGVVTRRRASGMRYHAERGNDEAEKLSAGQVEN